MPKPRDIAEVSSEQMHRDYSLGGIDRSVWANPRNEMVFTPEMKAELDAMVASPICVAEPDLVERVGMVCVGGLLNESMLRDLEEIAKGHKHKTPLPKKGHLREHIGVDGDPIGYCNFATPEMREELRIRKLGPMKPVLPKESELSKQFEKAKEKSPVREKKKPEQPNGVVSEAENIFDDLDEHLSFGSNGFADEYHHQDMEIVDYEEYPNFLTSPNEPVQSVTAPNGNLEWWEIASDPVYNPETEPDRSRASAPEPEERPRPSTPTPESHESWASEVLTAINARILQLEAPPAAPSPVLSEYDTIATINWKTLDTFDQNIPRIVTTHFIARRALDIAAVLAAGAHQHEHYAQMSAPLAALATDLLSLTNRTFGVGLAWEELLPLVSALRVYNVSTEPYSEPHARELTRLTRNALNGLQFVRPSTADTPPEPEPEQDRADWRDDNDRERCMPRSGSYAQVLTRTPKPVLKGTPGKVGEMHTGVLRAPRPKPRVAVSMRSLVMTPQVRLKLNGVVDYDEEEDDDDGEVPEMFLSGEEDW
ncbi:hypothetical protein EDC01DRAFT_785136 [Geopyxis carbonaria]|nr:hypothetical protein EDC01DRAFT_785136 [Geopyxis carbonaria]